MNGVFDALMHLFLLGVKKGGNDSNSAIFYLLISPY
jgi:hypothetical protein